MILKLKKNGLLGYNKEEHKINLDSVILKEDLLNPENERIHLFFKGDDSSGIILMNMGEVEKISTYFKARNDIMNGSKILKSDFEDFEYEKKTGAMRRKKSKR